MSEGREEKQRIEKDAEELVKKHSADRALNEGRKKWYIAGATAENNRLSEQLAKAKEDFDKLHTASNLTLNELAKERELRKELVEGLESVIRLKPLIEYTGMPEEKHIGEAMAISGMLSKVEALIKKGT